MQSRSGSLTTQRQYSDETATLLAKELLDGAVPETTIVVISAPSVFVALKNLVVGWQDLYGSDDSN